MGEGAFSGKTISDYVHQALMLFYEEVYEGKWKNIQVAIKRLKLLVDDKLFIDRFLREVASLKYVLPILPKFRTYDFFCRKSNHQNVVMLFGVCLEPPCIITEVSLRS